ncbi:MAG: iron-containing alcohol dehydrogenase [Thermodesulfobacteriota bacterium]|jgi:alcohol dehydrogenase YqhD (iron-dependent ADH family)
MFDFVFHNPTKIVFGRKQEESIGEELKNAGKRNVLFVYGRDSIKRSGLFGRIVASLNRNGIGYVEFGGVVSNPVISHTRQGVELAKREKVDAVLAVGGGSVLDEGKAIAVGAMAADDVWNYFTGKQVTKALPVFTVITLAATGSEMNGNAVVTNEETKQKYNIGSPYVYPRVSILNPELTCTVPLNYSAFGAVDAIAHVIEGYFTRKAGARLQDRLVESIIKTVIETNNVIMKEPDNYAARAEFMWAATLALNGLTTAGLKEYSFPNHMIEHSLSAIYNIAHGAGLAIVMPAWMKWYSAKAPARFARFGREIFGVEGAAAGISALEEWFASIHAPIRLQDANIPAGDIGMIAENAAALATLWGIGGIYSKDVIADILQLAV